MFSIWLICSLFCSLIYLVRYRFYGLIWAFRVGLRFGCIVPGGYFFKLVWFFGMLRFFEVVESLGGGYGAIIVIVFFIFDTWCIY